MMRFIGVLLFSAVSVAYAGKAHRHGVAYMQLAVEQTQVVLAMEIPLDSLVGFERAPRNEAERKAGADALAKMKEAGALFKFDAAAACRLKESTVEAPVLEGKTPSTARTDEHAQLEASFVFVCNDPGKITRLDVNLFDTFRRIEKIEGQAVTLRGQHKIALSASSRVLRLTP